MTATSDNATNPHTDIRRTRELWLIEAIDVFRSKFAELGYPLPAEVHVSVGFGYGAKRESAKLWGQCWSRVASADNLAHIFISPEIDDTAEVLRVLLHECIHWALDSDEGIADGHTKRFSEIASAWGFNVPMTETPAGPSLYAEFFTIAVTLGHYPHGKLEVPSHVRSEIPVSVGPTGKRAYGGPRISTGPRPQRNTRTKLSCTTADCICGGYTVLVTQRWLDIGLPSCPAGQKMHPVD